MTKYIYLHPLFEERKHSHRFSFELYHKLKQNGIEIIRFDYTGTGESTGSFEQVTFKSLFDDIFRKTQYSQAILIGLRLGASIAFKFAICYPELISQIMMISPIILGSKYIEQLTRKQYLKDCLTKYIDPREDSQQYINIEGYKTNRIFINEINNLALLGNEQIPQNLKIKIVNILNNNYNKADSKAFIDLLLKSNLSCLWSDIKFPAFWERIAQTSHNSLVNKICEALND